MEIAKTALTDQERLSWLRLYRTETIGNATFFRLIERFGSAERAIEALPDLARRAIAIPAANKVQQEIENLSRLGGRLITAADPDFPPALSASGTTPLIMTLGQSYFLGQDAVAVVGARSASLAGRRLAESLSRDLSSAGIVVVSGMARGIDRAAHEGALPGPTIAVLAGGVDNIYPPEHRELYRRICAEGCIISEIAPGTQPTASHFPRRNRLISGLSLGVVVVEATQRSGSLITARIALEQGRELFAVPGSPLDPRCRGPNGLIKNGATLVENANDILGALANMRQTPQPTGSKALNLFLNRDERVVDGDQAHQTVMESLSASPVTVDEIVRQCQLSPAAVSMVLLDLELAGKLERHPGNSVSLLS
ncbi:MAG TPA: DNA-protecting protein DprA [Rhodospirillaceae bacterium]|nr:DNA-protecting protein DprA [Rhodospirillaceae bacterium]